MFLYQPFITIQKVSRIINFEFKFKFQIIAKYIKVKKQPHNITHVEILLGQGEKTIGARWNNGKIQIFDSYKFESKSYHSQKYYFKSIDPWLLGYCNRYRLLLLLERLI